MTLWNDTSAVAQRHPAAMTIILGATGFLCGFLLSLAVAAHSLYLCIQI